MITEEMLLAGEVLVELFGPDGELKAQSVNKNVITDSGDQRYGEAGGGVAAPLTVPNGTKLGSGAVTGGNLPAKSGGGAVLAAYIPGTNHAIDGGYPTSAKGTVRDITYRVSYALGEGTFLSPVTEAALVNDAGTNLTSDAAHTYSRVALVGIPSKQAGDTLVLTWKHSIGT